MCQLDKKAYQATIDIGDMHEMMKVRKIVREQRTYIAKIKNENKLVGKRGGRLK